MRIALASDHAGFQFKELLKRYLHEKGHEIVDFGTDSEESVDYPRFILPAAVSVAQKECDRAIVLGGSGNGEAMAANRIRGVRCAVCWDETTARLARAHNNANAVAIGQRLVSIERAVQIVDIWLETEFEGGRHVGRIHQLDEADEVMKQG